VAAKAARFRFDAGAHAYYVGARRLPSITQVLAATAQPSGPGNGRAYYTAEAAERGTRIHAATARYDLGAGWGEDVLAVDVPRVRAYAAFLLQHQPRYDEIEQPRWSRTYGFAGTPDRVGRWPDGRHFVLDLKTGPAQPDHGLQTAAQVLLTHTKPAACLRYTLHLRDDETYRLLRWDDPNDFTAFYMRLEQFKRTHKEDTDGEDRGDD